MHSIGSGLALLSRINFLRLVFALQFYILFFEVKIPLIESDPIILAIQSMPLRSRRQFTTTLAITALLTACGGGSSDDGNKELTHRQLYAAYDIVVEGMYRIPGVRYRLESQADFPRIARQTRCVTCWNPRGQVLPFAFEWRGFNLIDMPLSFSRPPLVLFSPGNVINANTPR